jgi:hypothetical protein
MMIPSIRFYLLLFPLLPVAFAVAAAPKQLLRQERPQLVPEDAASKLGREPPYAEDDIHLVFSSDCYNHHDWQSELVAFSALKVGQKGFITRVASGCIQGKTDFSALRRSVNPNYRVHIAPEVNMNLINGSDFTQVGKAWPYYNKVFGLQHWLQFAQPPVKESVIVMLDPDMMLLRPISPNGQLQGRFLHSRAELEKEGVLWWGDKTIPQDGITDLVREGHVVSQAYGQGTAYLKHPEARRLIAEIFGNSTQIFNLAHDTDGAIETSVGMPTMIHINDARKVFKLWADTIVPVHTKLDLLLNMWQADMTGWEMAVGHFGIKTTRLLSMMLSDPTGDLGKSDRWDGEGWSLVQDWHRDTCKGGPWAPDSDPKRMPLVIHFCHPYPYDHQFQAWAQWPRNLIFHKRHVQDNVLECGSPMPVEPPVDLKEKEETVMEHSNFGFAKMDAWLVCALTGGVKQMLHSYKNQFCEAGWNSSPVTPYQFNGAPMDGHGFPLESARSGSLIHQRSRAGLKQMYLAEPFDNEVVPVSM